MTPKSRVLFWLASLGLLGLIAWGISWSVPKLISEPPLSYGERRVVFTDEAQVSIGEQKIGSDLSTARKAWSDSQFGKVYFPIYSRSGNQIAFSAVTDEENEKIKIWTVDLEKNESQMVYEHTTAPNSPTRYMGQALSWSHDNSRIRIFDENGNPQLLSIQDEVLKDYDHPTDKAEYGEFINPIGHLNPGGTTSTVPSPYGKFIASATYIECGFSRCVGENALYIKWQYSPFKHKVASGTPYRMLRWLDDYYFLVEGGGNIFLMDVTGKIHWQTPGQMYDLYPK